MSNFSLGAHASSKSRLFLKKKHFWSFSNFKHEFERRLQVWKSWKSSFRIFFSVRMRFEISQPFPSSFLCSLNLPRALFKNWEHFEQQQLRFIFEACFGEKLDKKNYETGVTLVYKERGCRCQLRIDEFLKNCKTQKKFGKLYWFWCTLNSVTIDLTNFMKLLRQTVKSRYFPTQIAR